MGTQITTREGYRQVNFTTNPWPWRALTKAPEVPAGDETKGSMIVLAAKATSYKELDPGT